MTTRAKIEKSLYSISPDILNGVNCSNKENARRIINYPAMMVPSVQESVIKSILDYYPEEISLLDPFMGASNTLVTGMKFGVNVYGQDINPLSILISQVKTKIYDYSLSEKFEDLILKLDRSRSTKIEIDFNNIDKWFKKEVQVELSQIYRAILKEPDINIRKFYWVTLAEVIRLTSNDRTSTFKMHVRPLEEITKRNLSPKEYFKKIGKRNIADLLTLKNELSEKGFVAENSYQKSVGVHWGDSKLKINTKARCNLLVTSPPYGDNQTTVTYGQFSYLPLQWIPISEIDEKINIDYLKAIQSIDSLSLGGKTVQDYNLVERMLFEKSTTLFTLFQKFNENQRIKAKKVLNFFHDLDSTIDNILNSMEGDSYLIWTVGNRSVNKEVVENDNIITELFKSKGVDLFVDLERDILGKRMPNKNNFSSTMSKEKILIFKN